MFGSVFRGMAYVVIGGLVFGFWGALGGGLLAMFLSGRRQANQQEVFLRTVFSISGHMAKADGQVTEDEIRCAREVMEKIGLTPGQQAQAVEYFRLGTRPDFDLGDSLDGLRTACRRAPEMVGVFIEIQVAMACADGTLSPSERRVLEMCCAVLGFPEDRLRQFIQHYVGGFGDAGTGDAGGEPGLDWAYSALEVDADAPMSDVKLAYARKMKEFHPDKLASKGLPKEFMQHATEQTQQFTKAYQAIKKAQRGAA